MTSQSRAILWSRWALSIMVSGIVTALLSVALSLDDISSLPLITSIAGIAIGIAQWAALRGLGIISKWWIIGTAFSGIIGSAISWFSAVTVSFVVGRIAAMVWGGDVGFIVGGLTGLLIAGGVVSTTVGTTQWLLLRQPIPQAFWWVAMMALSGVLTVVAGIGVNLLIRTVHTHVRVLLLIVVCISMFGAVTGVALLFLLPSQDRKEN